MSNDIIQTIFTQQVYCVAVLITLFSAILIFGLAGKLDDDIGRKKK